MNPSHIGPGRQVKTLSSLNPGELLGTGIDFELRGNRRGDQPGVVVRAITGQSCDVWAVTHPDGATAAYHLDELKELATPSPKE